MRTKRTTCVQCGAPLPPGRIARCYTCRPLKVRVKVADPVPDREYTLEDRAAQALGHGISYGQLMAHVENQIPLPPVVRRIHWPQGSTHRGEKI